VNVFPSEIEAVVLEDDRLGGQYAIVVDRRPTLPELEVRAELASADHATRRGDVAGALQARLADRLRLRVEMDVGDPGAIPRQEMGKARRVFERTTEDDPFPPDRGPAG